MFKLLTLQLIYKLKQIPLPANIYSWKTSMRIIFIILHNLHNCQKQKPVLVQILENNSTQTVVSKK